MQAKLVLEKIKEKEGIKRNARFVFKECQRFVE